MQIISIPFPAGAVADKGNIGMKLQNRGRNAGVAGPVRALPALRPERCPPPRFPFLRERLPVWFYNAA